jgi:OPT family oligopeptide transporter
VTGFPITLNVLAEFIGGAWVEGNGLAMNFFKAYGYVTCAHAILWCQDLKLAHYLHIPPRHTFAAQALACIISTFVCVGILNFQMNGIRDVCTPEAEMKMTCPGINTFFTAAVTFGTVGVRRSFGENNSLYKLLLIAFPIGLFFPIAVFYAQKRFKHIGWLRQLHPVGVLYGGLYWAPYNISWVWPSVPIGYFSWVYVRKRNLAFWAKYNYVLSAAFSAGIALAGVIIFFAVGVRTLHILTP